MPVPVGRLAPKDQWDQNLLDRLFANTLYPTGIDFKRVEGYPPGDGCVLIIPGRYWHNRTADISEALTKYRWVLGIRVGDEEDLFDIQAINHPNIKWWVQTPMADRDYDARMLPLGFPPHFNHLVEQDRDTTVFLSAQNTHSRRQACFRQLGPLRGPKLVRETEGFTQGLDPSEYAAWMCAAKVAPCPSGAVSPDSFRVYEALEAHTIPIADDGSPVYDSTGYWRKLFPDAPFPILTSWDQLPGYIGDQLQAWPRNDITAWWIATKRRLARDLKTDLEALGAL